MQNLTIDENSLPLNGLARFIRFSCAWNECLSQIHIISSAIRNSFFHNIPAQILCTTFYTSIYSCIWLCVDGLANSSFGWTEVHFQCTLVHDDSIMIDDVAYLINNHFISLDVTGTATTLFAINALMSYGYEAQNST